jgi:hypothetical protein
MEVLLELGMGSVMVAFDRCLLQGAIHAFDLAVDPRVVRLGQPVLDAIGIVKHVEHVGTPMSGRPDTVLRQIGELDAVIGEHRVDFIGNGFDKGLEEVRLTNLVDIRC